jgi:hypothetical protein
MKRLFLVPNLLVLLLSACGTTPSAAPTVTSAPLPVLLVDAEHMIKPGLAYEIPAGEGFVLDASSFDFGTPTGPTTVQVVIKGLIYQTTWMSGATSQAIRAEELLPARGSSHLTVFDAGQELIIAIGSLTNTGRFSPMWVAVVDVK